MTARITIKGVLVLVAAIAIAARAGAQEAGPDQAAELAMKLANPVPRRVVPGTGGYPSSQATIPG